MGCEVPVSLSFLRECNMVTSCPFTQTTDMAHSLPTNGPRLAAVRPALHCTAYLQLRKSRHAPVRISLFRLLMFTPLVSYTSVPTAASSPRCREGICTVRLPSTKNLHPLPPAGWLVRVIMCQSPSVRFQGLAGGREGDWMCGRWRDRAAEDGGGR